MDLSAAAALLQIAGLPLHPLLVHATVVLTPLTALALGVSAAWPAALRRIGLALPLASVLVAVLVPITVLAGEALADVVGRTASVQRHEELGLMLVPWAVSLVPASLLVWGSDRLQRRARRSRDAVDAHRLAGNRRMLLTAWAIGILGVACAAGTLIVVVFTGDAGARAVWEGVV